MLGTPSYMAPEQVSQPQKTDHRADIYSLGVVFYEMLTGELPVGQFPPPSLKAQLDVRLDQVVLRALAKTPKRRYQNIGEVKSEVETITGSGGLPIAGPPAPRFPLWFESEGRRRPHWPGVMALVSQVGLTVIAGVSLQAFVLWLFAAPARITFTHGEILLLAQLAVLCTIMYLAARAAPRLMPRGNRTGAPPARKTRLATTRHLL